MSNMENNMSLLGSEFRKMRLAEVELDRAKLEQDLRKWCVEQVAPRNDVHDVVAEASKLYEWVKQAAG